MKIGVDFYFVVPASPIFRLTCQEPMPDGPCGGEVKFHQTEPEVTCETDSEHFVWRYTRDWTRLMEMEIT